MYTCTYYMRVTLWKSERCTSEYVCRRDCKHVCTRIQTHPYIYQPCLKSPTQILKESYTTPPTQHVGNTFVGLLQYSKTRRTVYIYEHI